jgi:hypothetical protein
MQHPTAVRFLRSTSGLLKSGILRLAELSAQMKEVQGQNERAHLQYIPHHSFEYRIRNGQLPRDNETDREHDKAENAQRLVNRCFAHAPIVPERE